MMNAPECDFPACPAPAEPNGTCVLHAKVTVSRWGSWLDDKHGSGAHG